MAGPKDSRYRRDEEARQVVYEWSLYDLTFSCCIDKADASVRLFNLSSTACRAAIEVNDDQLSHSLMDARQHAAMLSDLIRAERPDACWSDRSTLDILINELVAAKARRNEQRRTKLLELAHELEAGKVKHRFEARTLALNALRLKGIEELRAEAAISEQLKDLAGPDASEWLHWACSLQDTKDASVLTQLRRDFGALEHFAGEMEESYWIPGHAVRESSGQPSETPVQPSEKPAAEFAATASGPVSSVATDHGNAAQNARAQSNKEAGIGDSAESLPAESERQSSEAASVPEIALHPQAAPNWRPPAVAVHRHPSDIASSPPDSETMLSAASAGLQPEDQPSLDPSPNPDETDWIDLKKTLEWRLSAAEQEPPTLGQAVLRKASNLRRDLPRWIGKK